MAFATLVGLVVGSFLNVVVHRVPRRESVVYPASKCPRCGGRLRWFDNIPVLSYVVLGGRCRSCKARIPWRYPAVELLSGGLFGLAAYELGFGVELVRGVVFIAIAVALAFIDFEHQLLPNVIVGPAVVVGLALSVVADPQRWWVYPVFMVVVGGALLGLAVVYPAGMGMGDVKMGGMLGAFLGPYGALAVFIGALGGAIVGGVLMAAGRVRRRTPIPFGVFLSIGGVVSLLYGPELWAVYMRVVGL